jgi:hypothetical protein
MGLRKSLGCKKSKKKSKKVTDNLNADGLSDRVADEKCCILYKNTKLKRKEEK